MNKKYFDFLNRLNGTPSKSESSQNSQINHKESINVVLTKKNGKTKRF